MSDDEQPLDDSDFGVRGVEKSQNWTQMTPADPVNVPEPDLTEDDSVYKHLSRPAPPAEPLQREYQGPDGEPMPERESVTVEQAGHDIQKAREAEAKQLENEAREALSRALDGEQPDQPQLEQPPEIEQPQPEADPAYAQGQADEVEKLLQNPALRERVAAELQQHATVAEYAKQHYVNAATQLAMQVEALAATNFPELTQFAGNPQAMQGALQMLAKENPTRFAELQNFANRAAIVTEHAQKARAEQMQAVQQRQQEEFAQYAREQDARAFSNTPPEELTQIRNFIYADAAKAGISREMVNRHWSSNAALRHSYISELAADGARYRMAKAGIASHRHNPLKPVMRPGVSESGGPRDDGGEYASMERSLRGRDLTLKQAADLLSAKRARG